MSLSTMTLTKGQGHTLLRLTRNSIGLSLRDTLWSWFYLRYECNKQRETLYRWRATMLNVSILAENRKVSVQKFSQLKHLLCEFLLRIYICISCKYVSLGMYIIYMGMMQWRSSLVFIGATVTKLFLLHLLKCGKMKLIASHYIWGIKNVINHVICTPPVPVPVPIQN